MHGSYCHHLFAVRKIYNLAIRSFLLLRCTNHTRSDVHAGLGMRLGDKNWTWNEIGKGRKGNGLASRLCILILWC